MRRVARRATLVKSNDELVAQVLFKQFTRREVVLKIDDHRHFLYTMELDCCVTEPQDRLMNQRYGLMCRALFKSRRHTAGSPYARAPGTAASPFLTEA